jgi:hypothetical protein
MAQREILQLVALTADNLPEANELFSSWCCRGNERRGCREAVRHPLHSRRARLYRVREQLDNRHHPMLDPDIFATTVSPRWKMTP